MTPDTTVSTSTVVLLGPQRLSPTLNDAVKSMNVSGRIATITAGWQEREGDDGELNEHLDNETVNLRLYERTDNLIDVDRELSRAHRKRQDTLRQIQEVHQLRLSYAMDAARELMRRQGNILILGTERLAAIEAVRTLDAEHLKKIRAVHQEFDEKWRPSDRPEVARHRREIAALLDDCDALAVAGGHVAVLLNRLRFYGLGDLIGERPVFAWSAGAMAISEKVVLFHDAPPQGAGNAEVMDAGLGLCRGVVALPHARRRLNLGDPGRVALMSRRFAPATCLPLDDNVRAVWGPDGLRNGHNLKYLTGHGDVEELKAP